MAVLKEVFRCQLVGNREIPASLKVSQVPPGPPKSGNPHSVWIFDLVQNRNRSLSIRRFDLPQKEHYHIPYEFSHRTAC